MIKPGMSLLTATAAALVVGFLAVTSQSLWMDEGSTVFKALLPDIGTWWKMTLHLGGSDVQMPVYMFLAWVWNKIGANSEYALRCLNIPWLLLGALALRNIRHWVLLFLLSPFMWYYTGELRPYAMQVAGGCVAAAGLIGLAGDRGANCRYQGFHTTACGAAVLAISSLTGALWSIGIAVALLILQPTWIRQAGFWKRAFPWLLIGTLSGAYYIFTIIKGYRAASSEGGLVSLLFGFYELSGLGGIGPGRNEIRSNPAILLAWTPLLLPSGILLAWLWFRGLLDWLRHAEPRRITAGLAAILLPLCLLVLVGLIKDFQILGRHLSPMLSIVILPLALGLNQWRESRTATRILMVAIPVILAISSLCYRFAKRHERDDYRSASAMAFEALRNGDSVMWHADMNATRYYAYRQGGIELVNAIQVLESAPPSSLLLSDLVVVNRPDLRFRDGDFHQQLRSNFFIPVARFTGFEVWRSH